MMAFSFLGAMADEGMYPLSEIKRINFKKAGFKMTQAQMFTPGGNSQIDALVRIGGCTGSFISPEGLIITNHHCVFGSVANVSSPANDYLTNGYYAADRIKEIPVKDLTVKITLSYEDVSAKVLEKAKSISDPNKKIEAIRQAINEIQKFENEKNSGLSCEVSEMFTGKTYYLFRYQTIQDIRLVYVPPRNIGEFGGESDNWVWPRHTGDFSIVRAYVSKDGKPAAYSPDNVAFKPKRILKIDFDGVNENEMVFILGYPGRTFKNYPASYLQYQKNQLLPITTKVNDYLISSMNALAATDPRMMLKFAGKTKSLANVTKNYKGKMQGLRRTSILADKAALDEKIKAHLSAQSGGKNAVEELNKVYAAMELAAPRDLWVNNITTHSGWMNMVATIESLQSKANKTTNPDSALSALLVENSTKWKSILANYHPSLEKDFLLWMMKEEAQIFGDGQPSSGDRTKLVASNGMVENFAWWNFVPEKVSSWKLADWQVIMKNPMYDWAKQVMVLRAKIMEENNTRQGILAGLMPEYLEARQAVLGDQFLPDANATLRLTFGNVKGYSPDDAIYQAPVTTLKGVLEKGSNGGDFEYPTKLKELHEAKDFGDYIHPTLKDVPVAILYNLDTSGGNSGSPVMNNKGELVAINFDRAYTATINDFAWDDKYSRSIGCDIRYVLFVIDKFSGAQNLMKEIQNANH